MKLNKIKHKDEKTEIKWTTVVDLTGDETKSELTSTDTPEPEFVQALQALKADVLELLELPEGYGEGLRVTGVSLAYDDEGRMGATVTSLKTLTEANAPLVLNTPYLPETDIDDDNPQMTAEMERHVDELIARAKRFIEGKRAQQDMFDDDGIESVTFESGDRSVTLTGEDTKNMRRHLERV